MCRYEGGRLNYVLSLLEELLEGEEYYHHGEVLNSDGRKLLEKILSMLLRDYPELKAMARRVRRGSTRRDVAKLFERVLSICEPDLTS